MNNKLRFGAIFAGLYLLASFFVSCLEGPEGPAGEDGETDTVFVYDSVFSMDTTFMLDTTLRDSLLANSESCKLCHNDETELKAKQLQYANSGHAVLGDFERSTASCAGCHTSEGFVERITLGVDTVAEDIINPTPQNCRTCHTIHTVYDSTDYQLRVEGEVHIHLTGEDFDLGKGALCASCHQPRTSYAIPGSDGEDSVEISSTRFGPHYGAQATMFVGTGGYEIDGYNEYENSEHATKIENACTECHMGKPQGAVAGGHQFGYRYEYHGSERELLTGCVDCHEDIESLDYEGVQTKMDSLMTVLEGKLIEVGVLDSNGGTIKGTYAVKEAGALWNLRMQQEDGSRGVHNYPYQSALLKNSIRSIK